MDGTIQQLHCRYRLCGDRGSHGAVAQRLERVARQALLQAYAAALEEHFGSGLEVIVVRHVHARGWLPLDAMPTDVQLARRWGGFLAAAVVRRIAQAGGGDADVVRFTDQADYLCCLLTDVLQGRSWDRWYFAAWRHLRDLPSHEVVRRALLEDRQHLRALLVRLHQRKLLDDVLRVVDAATLRTLWHAGVRQAADWSTSMAAEDAAALCQLWLATGRLPPPPADPKTLSRAVDELSAELPWLDGSRLKAQILELLASQGVAGGSTVAVGAAPASTSAGSTTSRLLGIAMEPARAGADRALFDQALRLVDLLQLWAEGARRADDLFARYQPGTVIDWRDALSLSVAVLDVLAYLHEAGQLRLAGAGSQELAARFELASSTYSWLDVHRLRTGLLELSSDEVLAAGPISLSPGRTREHLRQNLAAEEVLASEHKAAPLPLEHRSSDAVLAVRVQAARRYAPSLTPRQQALLRELRAGVDLRHDSSPADASALALRLYAQIAARYPHWSDDSLALRLIEALAYVHSALTSLQVRNAVALARTGEVEAALSALPSGTVNGVRAGLRLLASLGPSALELLEPQPVSAGKLERSSVLRTECAGVFLMLRAIADLKLPGLAKRGGYPRGETSAGCAELPLAMLLRLAGAEGAQAGMVDAGLSHALLGCAASLETVRARWSMVSAADHQQFQMAVLQVLARQRLIAPQRLHLFVLEESEGGPAWVAGDECGTYWPLGAVGDEAADSQQRASLLQAWLRCWREALSTPPELAIGAQCAGLFAAGADVRTLIVSDESHETGPEMLYRRGRAALVGALQALSGGTLGLPMADLSLGLLSLTVLRSWARWLPRFATASVAHLLSSFVRRRGTLLLDDDKLIVEMEPAPLDVVLEMSGYLRELERVEWLGGRRVQYRIRR